MQSFKYCQFSEMLYSYDAVSNRIGKSVDGALTSYAYNELNQLVSLDRAGGTLYYVFNGHDDTRMLVDASGNVTDTYVFDAWGNILERTGDTENPFLYCGEQFDSFTGLYYLRARYMNPSTGTFISMDTYQGSVFDPETLHKYLYANANPVMFVDPSGHFAGTLADTSTAVVVSGTLSSIAVPNMMGMLTALLMSVVAITAAVMGGLVLKDILGKLDFGTLNFGELLQYTKACLLEALLAIVELVMFAGGKSNPKDLEKGMSANQKGHFQREIEDWKARRGMPPDGNVPWRVLVALAEYVRQNYS